MKHMPGVELRTNVKRVWQDFIFGFYSPRDETYFENINNVEPGVIFSVDATGKVSEHTKIDSSVLVPYSDEALLGALSCAVKNQIPD